MGVLTYIKFLIEIVAIFIFVKFLLFPMIGLISGAQVPIAGVISGSMEHDGNFTEWWSVHEDFYNDVGINKVQFKAFPLSDGFNTGSLMILQNRDSIEIGDVIVFKSESGEYIIHRVIRLEPSIITKGDYNMGSIDGLDTDIKTEDIVGQGWIYIPYAAYPKIWAMKAIGFFQGLF